MLENKNKFGFTLSELITALGIIGILAAMSVPALFENIHKRTAVAQLKSMIGNVQNLANVQIATKVAKELDLTDFSNPSTLFNDKYFIHTKKCSSSTALTECWEIPSGTTKYKAINGTAFSPVAMESVVLKSGAILGYRLYTGTISNTNEKIYGQFLFDVNGVDKPNIVGRDLFAFYITRSGRIYGSTAGQDFDAKNSCKNGGIYSPNYCTNAIIHDNWQMNY